jgi:plasmid stabilization system protein ParE
MLPLFYLVGGLAAVFSRNAQRLGDMAANTIVTRERKAETPDLEQIAPAKYNSLLAQPHLAARLRSLVTPEAAALAVRAVTLRDSYDPRARVALFRELAGHFRRLVEFPEEAVENLIDEQYVRSVLRVIYGGSFNKFAFGPPSSREGGSVAIGVLLFRCRREVTRSGWW